VYGVLAEGITFRLQGTVTPHAFMGQHKIISDGKIIAVAAGQDKTHGTLTPRPRQHVHDVPGRPTP
jgi:hypothetical protein